MFFRFSLLPLPSLLPFVSLIFPRKQIDFVKYELRITDKSCTVHIETADTAASITRVVSDIRAFFFTFSRLFLIVVSGHVISKLAYWPFITDYAKHSIWYCTVTHGSLSVIMC